jgi:hypothetical protein
MCVQVGLDEAGCRVVNGMAVVRGAVVSAARRRVGMVLRCILAVVCVVAWCVLPSLSG